MTAPSPAFDQARFRHPWRPYQTRVLDALDRHLADRQLHVIAPPGSGKTVLGLEALRRLGRPALVLTPTLTIREQWIERLHHDFEYPQGRPAISRDALQPARLTFITYQGLYQLFRSQHDEALIAALRRAGVQVIAADEAHHLRSEWWRCIDQLKAGLDEVHTLCLTATPPYDAPMLEWRRYSALAGEVDEEIGVPELVRDGSLCAHQDLLLLLPPDAAAEAELRNFHTRMATLPARLSLDDDLIDALATLPDIRSPAVNRVELARDAPFWLALAVLLGNTRWEAARPLLDALDLREVRLPPFDLRWAEILLSGWLIERRIALPDLITHRWRELLSEARALHGKRFALQRHPREARLLTPTRTMLQAVMQIVESESANFGESLRLVILADHVRPHALAADASDADVLGVAPIFQQLRRRKLAGIRPAVLTGSLVVMPATSWPAVSEQLYARSDRAIPTPCEVEGAADFLRLDVNASDRARLVSAVTALFEAGDINLLCGTAALLGEGWDAPATNSLVLATSVSTHVSSNQLRGRGLRSRRDHPHKCSNLWHLCGVQRLDDAAELPERRPAPASMSARFRSFVGLHFDDLRLESGLDRLGRCFAAMRGAEIDGWNRRMFQRAAEVHQLPARWRQAIGEDRLARSRQLRELRIPARAFGAALHWRAGSGLMRLIEPRLSRWTALPGVDRLLNWIMRRRLRAMAQAVVHAMSAADMLPRHARPELFHGSGLFHLRLHGVDRLQEQRFLDAVSELFDPLADPRYLLRDRDTLLCVPAAFGQRREYAEAFLSAWTRRVGAAELLYTRNAEGRLVLLRAKQVLLLHLPDWQLEQRAVWSAAG